jgi:hypothetical protein
METIIARQIRLKTASGKIVSGKCENGRVPVEVIAVLIRLKKLLKMEIQFKTDCKEKSRQIPKGKKQIIFFKIEIFAFSAAKNSKNVNARMI